MASIKPFTVSNELLDQPEKLREQAQQDGYLFFRGLIDADSIYNLRRDFLEICHRHGWAEGGDALMDGIRTGGPYMEGDDGYWPVLDEFQSMESFHAFAHHPAILDMCDKLFGEKDTRASAEYRKNYVPRKHEIYNTVTSGLYPYPRHRRHLYRMDTARSLSNGVGWLVRIVWIASGRNLSCQTRIRCRWTRY